MSSMHTRSKQATVDKRLDQRIAGLEHLAAHLLALRTRHFDWKNDRPMCWHADFPRYQQQYEDALFASIMPLHWLLQRVEKDLQVLKESRDTPAMPVDEWAIERREEEKKEEEMEEEEERKE